LPFSASENEIVLNVSTGPRKSIHVVPNGFTGLPVARSTVATASVFSFAIS
jgi:hypothetical protein